MKMISFSRPSIIEFIETPYTGAVEMLLQINGEFTFGKLMS
jgi:hypothetical protein